MTEHSLAVVVNAFSLDGELRTADRYGSGHIHETFCVSIDHGGENLRIILQRINTEIFKNPVAVMENIERVTNHLRGRIHGKPEVERHVLQLVRTRGGPGWHVDAKGQYWRAYRFIEGASANDTVSSPRQAFNAAKAFGQFQQLLADLPDPRLHESIPYFHNTPKRFAAFEDAVA